MYVRGKDPADLAAGYEELLEVEASGWKGAHGSSIRRRPWYEAFYRDLLGRLVRDGHCEVRSLRAEGRCIAAGFWVYTGRGCVLLKCGYDESYAQASPGRLLTHKGLEWACDDPGVDFVSLIGDAPWLRHWNPETRVRQRAYIPLRPVSGRALVAAMRLRYGLVRSLVREVKAWWRKRDDATRVRRGRDSE